MPEVGDPRLRAAVDGKTRADALHGALDRVAPAVQDAGVHVSLERDFALDEPARLGGIDLPVEPERVVARALCEGGQCVVCAFREENERYGWEVLGGEALADVGRDVYQGRPREEIKVVRGEFAGP